MRKKALFIAAAGAALATLAVAGIQRGYRLHHLQILQRDVQEAAAKLPPVAPVTVQFNETLRAPGKAGFVSTEETLAIRGDGSVHRIQKRFLYSGLHYMTHWEISLADGLRAEGEDELRAMTVRRERPGIGATLEKWDPNSGCAMQVNRIVSQGPILGKDWISGNETVRLVASDNSTARTTVWRAPALNCLELRRLAEFKNPDGGIRDSSELIATAIAPGEPGENFFHIPENYDNVSYSERYKRQEAFLGRTVPEFVPSLARWDDLFSRQKVDLRK